MTLNKKLWQSRADIRGGIYAGLRDRAFVTTMTHSQWSTPAWGGTRDLQVDLDGGVHSQIITLSPSTTYTIDELVALINTAFAGVGTVAFKFRAGRLQLRSTREGVGSEVDVSSSDADVLTLLEFDFTDVIGRQIEDAQENDGVETNPPGTRLIATGEQHVKEILNRPAIFTASVLDLIQGYLNSYYAVPTIYTVTGPDTRTVEELGGVRNLLVTITTNPPQIGETIIGQVSGTVGVVANYVLGFIVVAPPGGGFAGDFQVGEDLDGSSTGAAFAQVVTQRKDDRIAAVKLPGRAYVGGYDQFGLAAPTPDDFENFFQLTIYKDAEGEGLPRNTHNKATTPSATASYEYPGTDQRDGEPTRVKHVCAGVPDDPYTPTNIYDHQGIVRQSAVNVTSWTKNRIYPASFSNDVAIGDVAIITGSASGGVDLNNGRYSVVGVNATDGYYEIGPSKSANTGAGLPEDTLNDAEIYESNGTVGVQVTVTSPSYLLEDARQDYAAVDRTAWALLEHPVEETQTLTLAYYTISSIAYRPVGVPEFESPWSRYLRARVDTIEDRLSRAQFGSLIRGTLLNNPPTRPMGSYGSQLVVRAYGSGTASPDSFTKYNFTGPGRTTMFSVADTPSDGPSDAEPVFRAGAVTT
ncbi:MAG: hypothetical protein KDB07_02715 [Planctomycetes bacterium]|nr:hypothetical protein [Planctomycetota bacterium]